MPTELFWHTNELISSSPVLQVPTDCLIGLPLKQFPAGNHYNVPSSINNNKISRQNSWSGHENSSSNKTTMSKTRNNNSGGAVAKRQQSTPGAGGRMASTVPQTQHQRASTNPKYKTEYCHSVYENVACKYGDICQFAHSQDELRNRSHHMKYKTIDCKSFAATGVCMYGPKCDFRHKEPTPEVPIYGNNKIPAETPPHRVTTGLLNVSIGGAPIGSPTQHQHHQQLYWPTSPAADSAFGGTNSSTFGNSPVPSTFSNGCDSPLANSQSPDLWDLPGGGGDVSLGNVWGPSTSPTALSSNFSQLSFSSPLPKVALPEFASYFPQQQQQHPQQHPQQQHRYCYQNPVEFQSLFYQAGGSNNNGGCGGSSLIRCQ